MHPLHPIYAAALGPPSYHDRMPKAPTVYDVAERAAVSIATVSRVLRNPDAVKPDTRERVLDAVRFLGYVPSASARGLASQRTNVIGLFFPSHDDHNISTAEPLLAGAEVPVVNDGDDDAQIENLYFDEVLRGAEIEAWRRGFALVVAAGRGASRESLVNDLAGRVDGLAVLSRTVSDELLAHVARRIPVVVLAGAAPGDAFDHVSANNTPGMRAMASHVFSTHQPEQVVYLAGPIDSPDDAERFIGFQQAMKQHAVAKKALIRKRGDFTRESGARAAAALELTQKTAIICANDQMALGVLDVLEKRGIEVPRHVLVTGFDGIAAGRHSRPTLTTVHQPMVELGRAAIHAITRRLDDPDLPQQNLTLPVRVILRESCP